MRKLTPLLLALTLVCSCNNLNDQPDPSPNDNEVSFTDGGILFTRVIDSQFENGDEVNVRATFGNNIVDEALYSYANRRFTSTSPFVVTEGQQLAYKAIYPSSAKFAGTHEIFADQSSAENYELSDLLVASVPTTEATTPELTFKHIMSNIILNLTVLDNGQISTETDVEVTFNLKTAADIDVAEQSYVGTGDVNTITPYCNLIYMTDGIYNYSVIAAPQTIPANTAIANVVVNGTENFQLVRPTELKLLSSKQYVYSFTVDVATRESTIEFDGEIDNWGEPEDEDIEQLSGVYTLADFAKGKIPRNTDSWVITDETATTEDFEGLRAAIMSLQTDQRFISLSFPNLVEFPEKALYLHYDHSVYGNSTIKSITADAATTIGKYALYFCAFLENISFPEATTIGDYAFSNCWNATNISLPKIEEFDWNWVRGQSALSEIAIKDKTYTAENGVFYNEDKSILYKYIEQDRATEFNAPESVLEIKYYAFESCEYLSSVSFPEATVIGHRAFANNGALTNVSIPKASIIGYDAFLCCTNLANVSFPVASIVDLQAFFMCESLTDLSFPAATAIGAQAFTGCSGLTNLSLPMATTIGEGAFGWCNALSDLEIATEAELTSVGINILNMTPTENVALVIGSENDGVDVNARTWSGYTFKSISQQ